jgi:uncharacterized membrane protein
LEEVVRAIKNYNLVIPSNAVVSFKEIEKNEKLNNNNKNVDTEDENNSSISFFAILPKQSTTNWLIFSIFLFVFIKNL